MKTQFRMAASWPVPRCRLERRQRRKCTSSLLRFVLHQAFASHGSVSVVPKPQLFGRESYYQGDFLEA